MSDRHATPQPSKPAARAEAAQGRAERLAAALRLNLAQRKAQKRARAAGDAGKAAQEQG